MDYFDFEQPLVALEAQIGALERDRGATAQQLATARRKLARARKEVYGSLTPWQTVQIARHPDRPTTLDYIRMIAADFVEMHGDRCFEDDPSIVGGLATLGGRTVMFIGQQKGHDAKERVARNFGMPRPEGYRKALRLMKLAERFAKPIVCLVDTPGAYPGIGAEERGQAEAIARNICEMSGLRVPIVVVVTGEGMSGGALAIGVGDTLIMQQHAIFAVISPEGCASILWQDAGKAEEAAKALKFRALELFDLGIIDDVVKEPMGGAHRAPARAARQLKKVIVAHLNRLARFSVDELVADRYEKYRRMGLSSLS